MSGMYQDYYCKTDSDSTTQLFHSAKLMEIKNKTEYYVLKYTI